MLVIGRRPSLVNAGSRDVLTSALRNPPSRTGPRPAGRQKEEAEVAECLTRGTANEHKAAEGKVGWSGDKSQSKSRALAWTSSNRSSLAGTSQTCRRAEDDG